MATHWRKVRILVLRVSFFGVTRIISLRKRTVTVRHARPSLRQAPAACTRQRSAPYTSS